MEFHWHQEVTSTNDEAKKLAVAGAEHGTLVGADYQIKGRGRTGKSWECAVGEGLMCSIIVRPKWSKPYWGWVALMTGLVISDLLERDCLYPRIKYPNDILVNGKKIAGILTEASSGYVVVGIGMNLNMKYLPVVDSAIQPTSFLLETDCELDARSYAETVQRSLATLVSCDSPLLFRGEIERRVAWKGERVMLKTKTATMEGVIRGIGEYGQLLLEGESGELEVFDAYEIRPMT